jgi:colanic acid/amylovoran biosynthesis protein
MSDRLLVEVAGVYLPNVGARFMLSAARSDLVSRLPGAEIAMAPQSGSFDRRAELGVRQVLRTTGRGRGTELLSRFDRLSSHRLSSQLHKYGVVLEHDVDALLDISGFAMSDQWGAARAVDRSERACRYRRRGRPVVFLPQSVGPLRQPATRAAFLAAVNAADRFFVRDAASLQAAMEVASGLAGRLALMPDLTLAVDVAAPGPETDGAFILVPNGRLVDPTTGTYLRRDYVDLLVMLATAAVRRGLRPQVVVHTDERIDDELASAVADRIGVDVVRVIDSVRFKEGVGPATIVVASRFHALLGALSRGASCIAIGWAEKYVQIMSEYELESFVIHPDDPPPQGLLDELLDRQSTGKQAQVAATIVEGARARLAAMWDDVAALLVHAG